MKENQRNFVGMMGVMAAIGLIVLAIPGADRPVMRDSAARYGGAPTHATISSGTTIANGATATFSFTTGKESWWVRNGGAGRIYYRIDDDTCTRQTSHGYLESGESITLTTVNLKLTVLNSSGATLQYDSATKELWIVAWD